MRECFFGSPKRNAINSAQRQKRQRHIVNLRRKKNLEEGSVNNPTEENTHDETTLKKEKGQEN